MPMISKFYRRPQEFTVAFSRRVPKHWRVLYKVGEEIGRARIGQAAGEADEEFDHVKFNPEDAWVYAE